MRVQHEVDVVGDINVAGNTLYVATVLALSGRASEALAALRHYLARAGGGSRGRGARGASERLEVFKRLWFAGQMTTLGWGTYTCAYVYVCMYIILEP